MAYEIEAKLKCQDHESLRKVLEAAGAEFAGESVQRDVYLDDASGSIKAMDAALRIRCQTPAGKVQVTFKGPHEDSSLKKRSEVNLDVSSADGAEELFAGLGYSGRFTVEKRRAMWLLGGCQVALDELPSIGRFVEIEGPDEAAVSRVQQMLGLGGLPHIPQSYAALIEEKTQRR